MNTGFKVLNHTFKLRHLLCTLIMYLYYIHYKVILELEIYVVRFYVTSKVFYIFKNM